MKKYITKLAAFVTCLCMVLGAVCAKADSLEDAVEGLRTQPYYMKPVKQLFVNENYEDRPDDLLEATGSAIGIRDDEHPYRCASYSAETINDNQVLTSATQLLNEPSSESADNKAVYLLGNPPSLNIINGGQYRGVQKLVVSFDYKLNNTSNSDRLASLGGSSFGAYIATYQYSSMYCYKGVKNYEKIVNSQLNNGEWNRVDLELERVVEDGKAMLQINYCAINGEMLDKCYRVQAPASNSSASDLSEVLGNMQLHCFDWAKAKAGAYVDNILVYEPEDSELSVESASANGVGVNSGADSITYTFNVPLQQSKTMSASVLCDNADIAKSFEISDDKKTVTVFLKEPLKDDKVYRVSLKGLCDIYGTSAQDISEVFATADYYYEMPVIDDSQDIVSATVNVVGTVPEGVESRFVLCAFNKDRIVGFSSAVVDSENTAPVLTLASADYDRIQAFVISDFYKPSIESELSEIIKN